MTFPPLSSYPLPLPFCLACPLIFISLYIPSEFPFPMDFPAPWSIPSSLILHSSSDVSTLSLTTLLDMSILAYCLPMIYLSSPSPDIFFLPWYALGSFLFPLATITSVHPHMPSGIIYFFSQMFRDSLIWPAEYFLAYLSNPYEQYLKLNSSIHLKDLNLIRSQPTYLHEIKFIRSCLSISLFIQVRIDNCPRV